MNEESVISFEAITESSYKCQENVRHKESVSRFITYRYEESLKLSDQLRDGTYKHGKPRRVEIYYPKRRTAYGNRIRDRVYQRSLNDNVLYSLVTKGFIYANLACQKGKGTDLAREYFAEQLKRHYRKHGTRGGILQCDVKGYYDNMRHDRTERKFERCVPEWASVRAKEVLDHQYSGKKGYNPGSQMVQIAGIANLDDLDHFIKEKLRVKSYIRYMDDFILTHEDAEYLKRCRKEIETKLQEEGLWLHPDKTKIHKMTDKIRFLGFDFRLTKTGKVVMTIDPENVKHERKKLYRAVAKAKRGEIQARKVHQMFKSWKAHARKGNSVRLIENMNEYYKKLWRTL